MTFHSIVAFSRRVFSSAGAMVAAEHQEPNEEVGLVTEDWQDANEDLSTQCEVPLDKLELTEVEEESKAEEASNALTADANAQNDMVAAAEHSSTLHNSPRRDSHQQELTAISQEPARVEQANGQSISTFMTEAQVVGQESSSSPRQDFCADAAAIAAVAPNSHSNSGAVQAVDAISTTARPDRSSTTAAAAAFTEEQQATADTDNTQREHDHTHRCAGPQKESSDHAATQPKVSTVDDGDDDETEIDVDDCKDADYKEDDVASDDDDDFPAVTSSYEEDSASNEQTQEESSETTCSELPVLTDKSEVSSDEEMVTECEPQEAAISISPFTPGADSPGGISKGHGSSVGGTGLIESTTAASPTENPYPWIRKGVSILAEVGKVWWNAVSMGDPIWVDACWMVHIKWDSSRGETETIECYKCKQIELHAPRSTRRQRQTDIEDDKALSAGNKRCCRSFSQRIGKQRAVGRSAGATASFGGEDVLHEAYEEVAAVTPETVAATSNGTGGAAQSLPPIALFDSADSRETSINRAKAAVASIGEETDMSFDAYVRRVDDDGGGKPAAVATDADSDQPSGYKATKKRFCGMPGMREEEVVNALQKVGPPYGKQAVMKAIDEQRNRELWVEPTVPEFKKGTRILKMFDGRNFGGTITNDGEMVQRKDEDKTEAMMWQVKYDDSDEEEMELEELMRCHILRPIYPAPCRGRPLQCLELFCGRGIVTQAFAERKWKVASVDVAEESNATIVQDIMTMEVEDLPFVPDFIWASPPCQTYSTMGQGKHRSVKKGELEKSEEAHVHNDYFMKMTEIMHWAKRKHAHLIVAIENPAGGSLKKMPLMQNFTKTFELHSFNVDYCAFGRDERKRTTIWTNDQHLLLNLSYFTCEKKCCHMGTGAKHQDVQAASNQFDFSVIPQPLAEEVAESVHSELHRSRVRDRKAKSPREE